MIIGTIRKALFAVLLISLIVSNVLLVTSTAFHSVASEFFSYLPFEELLANSPSRKQKQLEIDNKKLRDRNNKLAAEQKVQKSKIARARTVSRKIVKRTTRNVSADLASAVFEATPYVGIAFVAAATALDVKDSCDTIRDINEILDAFGDETDNQAEAKVCGVDVPTADQWAAKIQKDIGGTIHQSKENIQAASRKVYEAINGTIYEIFH